MTAGEPGARITSPGVSAKDLEYLDLLSLFHYVVAALSLVLSLFPILHLVIGLLMVTGSFVQKSEDTAPLALMGGFFVTFASIWIVLGVTFSVCLALAGRFLKRRIHYKFCLVMAALSCLAMPFGTVLGVFTIVVLFRDSVRAMFEANARGGLATGAVPADSPLGPSASERPRNGGTAS